MEKVETMRNTLIEKISYEIENNIDHACTKELGEAVDMVKDLTETLYYMTVIEAMNHSTSEEIIAKALPNTNTK